MRYPSDDAIRTRAINARFRGQALGRNEPYCADVAALQDLGLRFGCDGFAIFEDVPPWALSEKINAVCQRAQLVLPVLPDKLRTLSLSEILDYANNQIFPDVPGWEFEPKNRKRFRAAVSRSASLLMPVPAARDFTIALTVENSLLLSAATRPNACLDDKCVANLLSDRASVRYQSVPSIRLTSRFRGPDRSVSENRFDKYWHVYDLSKLGRKEREIIDELWPGEAEADGSSFDKSPVRQRVYDYRRGAKRLIALAYQSASDGQ
jgi:hypothetical protein